MNKYYTKTQNSDSSFNFSDDSDTNAEDSKPQPSRTYAVQKLTR